MKILKISIFKGPNYWSINHKVAEIVLDTENNEEFSAKKIHDLYKDLKQSLPEINGFIETIDTGTSTGYLVGHLAILLQSVAGLKCGLEKNEKSETDGKYKIILSFEEDKAVIYAVHASLRIIEAFSHGQKYNPKDDVLHLKKITSDRQLGFSTASIVEAARTRNIPVSILDSGAIVQLGFGSEQKRISATTTDSTSHIAVDLTSNRYRTKLLLKSENIPVPEGITINDVSELTQNISKIGFPVVVKPNTPNHGKGATLNIQNLEQAFSAFNYALKYSDKILIERFHPGNDYSLLVIGYKLVAAARRIPANVTGDGVLTIRELIEMVNNDPARGNDHENALTRISINHETEEYLKCQGITLDFIPPQGRKTFVKRTANLSSGGTSEDVTEMVHSEIAAMAERVARIVGLNICSIDYISDNISQSLKKTNGVVIGVNASPGFRMHTHPFKGRSRNIGKAVIDMLFPQKNNGRIPIIAVTGTSGKTTTTRLIAHIARTAGFNVGFCTSDGAYVGEHLIEEGDCTGAASAEKILRDKSINFAVLECGRAALLHSGLPFDQCDAGIITNIEDDHLGTDDIHSLEKLTLVKSVIPLTVKSDGIAILNADNPYTCNLKNSLKCNVAFFSADVSNCALEHCSKGGTAAIYQNRKVLLIKNNIVFFSESIENIPLSFGGRANFMVENILAALLAAYFQGIDVEDIRKALRSFVPSFENIPGRLNVFQLKSHRILLDSAHNAYEIISLGSWLMQEYSSYKTGIITSSGDRRDTDITNIGKASAEIFDKIIIRVDEKPKERTNKEITGLLYSGVRNCNKNLQIEIFSSEMEAILYAEKNSKPGSLIVLFTDNINNSMQVIRKLIKQEEGSSEKQFSRVWDLR